MGSKMDARHAGGSMRQRRARYDKDNAAKSGCYPRKLEKSAPLSLKRGAVALNPAPRKPKKKPGISAGLIQRKWPETQPIRKVSTPVVLLRASTSSSPHPLRSSR